MGEILIRYEPIAEKTTELRALLEQYRSSKPGRPVIRGSGLCVSMFRQIEDRFEVLDCLTQDLMICTADFLDHMADSFRQNEQEAARLFEASGCE